MADCNKLFLHISDTIHNRIKWNINKYKDIVKLQNTIPIIAEKQLLQNNIIPNVIQNINR